MENFDRTFTSAVTGAKADAQPTATTFGYVGTQVICSCAICTVLQRAFVCVFQEKFDTSKTESGAESDNELSKYLNRGYWEARRSDQKKGILRNSPTPSAPVAHALEEAHVTSVALSKTCATGVSYTSVTWVVFFDGKLPENNTNGASNGTGPADQASNSAPEMTDFVEGLRLSLDVFVTRIRNDLARGRSVVADSSVQAMFLNLTSMHAQLLHHLAELEDRRGSSHLALEYTFKTTLSPSTGCPTQGSSRRCRTGWGTCGRRARPWTRCATTTRRGAPRSSARRSASCSCRWRPSWTPCATRSTRCWSSSACWPCCAWTSSAATCTRAASSSWPPRAPRRTRWPGASYDCFIFQCLCIKILVFDFTW